MSNRCKKLRLSKSRLVSAWQCPKKLHLELHSPELGETSDRTESLFALGNQVGALAQEIHGTKNAVEIAYRKNLSIAVRETAELITAGADFPIFEATFEHDGVLVRVDVLQPDGDIWNVIEVKASTSVKEHHIIDCAIQYWTLRKCGIKVGTISLAHIDNRFVYKGDNDYAGLLIAEDLTAEVIRLEPEVTALIAEAKIAAGNVMPLMAVGAHCNQPYECQFLTHCWPTDAKYPVMGLGGSKAKLGKLVEAGYRDIRDVDSESLTSPTQQRIHRVTCTGTAEVLEGAKKEIEALGYPRYYLDFETIAPAVPFWKGTRPYNPIAIQWSCHIDEGPTTESPDNLRHEEFLDVSGEPPMRPLAEHLIKCLSESGPILMYTSYEKRVIAGLAALFPDLSGSLNNIIDRLVDLHPIVKQHYYDPMMLGSWSIKAVLPSMAPRMSYSNLQGINEGTGASEGYVEAIDSKTTPERRAELEAQLLRYCRFDTEAMVEIVRFFNK